MSCLTGYDGNKHLITCFLFSSYRACYNYIIDDDDNCVITNPVVEDIAPFTVIDSETTLYLIETPLLETNLYPSNLICFFVIGKK